MKHLISLIIAISCGSAFAMDCDTEFERINDEVESMKDQKSQIDNLQSQIGDERSILNGIKRDIDDQREALDSLTGFGRDMAIGLLNSRIREYKSKTDDFNRHVDRFNEIIAARANRKSRLMIDFEIWKKVCN